MSDGGSPPSPVTPICSPLSPNDTPPSVAEEAPGGDTGWLRALLTRAREQGGYGGSINYTEFVAMTRPLGWREEDVEDCWYDVVRGVGVSEVTDMERVAEVIRAYCLAAPYPLPDGKEGGVPRLPPPPPPPAVPQINSEGGANISSAVGEKSDVAVQTTDTDSTTGKAIAKAWQNADGGVDSPRSTSVSSSSSSSSECGREPRQQPRTDRNGKREGLCGSHAQRVSAARPSPTAPAQRRNTRFHEDPAPAWAAAFKRYNVPTESSRRKRTPSPVMRSLRGSGSRPSSSSSPPRRSSPTPAAVEDRRLRAAKRGDPKGSATGDVFVRLYANATKASSAPAAAPPPDVGGALVCHGVGCPAPAAPQEEAAECTFRPVVTPYHSERLAKERAGRRDCYKKATRSSLARLLGEEARHDRLAEAPETPRVEVRPAPGPSSHVPPGYVEGVARLRLSAARRASSPCSVDFSQSLRGEALSKAQRASAERRQLAEATATPILRLPLADLSHTANANTSGDLGSARSCIDVRLASPLRQRKAESRHQSWSGRYAERSTGTSRRESPLRSSRAAEPREPGHGTDTSAAGVAFPARFKKHPPAYYSTY